MGTQSTSPQSQNRDSLDGFAVAVVHENALWRCEIMDPEALNSLVKTETILRELRSSGAVFGLLNVDEECFVILRPGPTGTRLLLSDAAAALAYNIADEILERLDIDVPLEELEESDLFEVGDLALLSDLGLSAGIVSLILDDADLDISDQLDCIAAEMGFKAEFQQALRKHRW